MSTYRVACGELTILDPMPDDAPRTGLDRYSAVIDVNVEMSWSIAHVSPEAFNSVLALFGLTPQLIWGPFEYKQRELHLNLARYTRWPYTN